MSLNCQRGWCFEDAYRTSKCIRSATLVQIEQSVNRFRFNCLFFSNYQGTGVVNIANRFCMFLHAAFALFLLRFNKQASLLIPARLVCPRLYRFLSAVEVAGANSNPKAMLLAGDITAYSSMLGLLSRTSYFRSVGKANEALTRIGMGLAANPSVTESEMLLYVHATVAPFLLPQVLNLGHTVAQFQTCIQCP